MTELAKHPVPIPQLFESQQATALRLRTSTAPQRAAKLAALRDALLRRREDFYAAFQADFRKPAVEVELSELLPVVDEISHAMRHLRRWMKPRRVGTTLLTLGTRSWIACQPRGRCLIIGPWNYPVNTLLGPLVSALAAGNTAILKPSEHTPAVNRVVAEVVAEVFSPDEVALVEGGADTAQALLALPFDHIFFTGSPEVGSIVMQAASRHLASVTLELGGKSPVIIDETADLARAAEVIVWAKYLNAGQTCVAPDYVLVQREVHDRFVAHCHQLVEARYGASAAAQQASPDLARIISTAHARRIGRMVDEAARDGAQVHAGGTHDEHGRFVAPTLVGSVPPGARLLRDEIFGPVLPIVPFAHLEEAVARINAQPKPLALYVWSRSEPNVQAILQRTTSGGACVNHCVQHYAHAGLPFGGVNHSGIGSAHGVHGFRAFSHERAVLRGSWLLTVRQFFPPYTPRKLNLAQALVRLVRAL
jgi:aldehyde dehydrogenase (NAD+)